MKKDTGGTPIRWPLRLWLIIEVLFGLGAVLSIALSPGSTKTNFAWPIAAVVMAALLGAFYITSAPLFLLPALARRWENIRVMILPAALFSSMQVIVTFLHWDKFSLGTLPFNLWLASYVLPPPIFLAAWLWHERHAPPVGAANDEPLPGQLRTALRVLAGIFVLGGLLVFALPSLLIPVFPWPLTPLTARSMCSWLIGIGALMWFMARENHRTRARLASAMLFVLLPAVLLQLSRFPEQVNWASPTLWIGLLLFGAAGVCGLALARGSWRVALR